MLIRKHSLRRKALIIYCTDTGSDSAKLPYVEKDYHNIKNFLMSCSGGCWNEDEIIPLESPTREEVEQCIKEKFRNVDYAFVVFSGHGYVDSSDGLQRVEVKRGIMTIVDLFIPTVAKQTIIIDACRVFYSTSFLTENRRSYSEILGLRDKERVESRQIFDAYIKAAPEGKNIIFAASLGTSSICDNDGSVFINSMIEKCREFSNNTANAKKVLNTEEAVNMIGSIEVESESGKEIQKPEIRFLNDNSGPFPIAVGKIPMIKGIRYDKETKRFCVIR